VPSRDEDEDLDQQVVILSERMGLLQQDISQDRAKILNISHTVAQNEVETS